MITSKLIDSLILDIKEKSIERRQAFHVYDGENPIIIGLTFGALLHVTRLRVH